MPARRFLAPAARQGDGKGYLSQPIRPYPIVADPPEVLERIRDATSTNDEIEAPSDAWVNAEADLAAERNRLRLLRQAEQARDARRQITIENRMRDAQRRAKLKHIDLGHEMHCLRKMLARDKRADASARLAKLEARLDGVHELDAA